MQMLKTKEVARRLNYSQPHVARLIREGHIKAVRIGRRNYRVVDAEVDRFIAALEPVSGASFPTPTPDDADVRSASSASDAGVSSPRAAASGPGSSEPTTPYTAQDTPIADHPIRETSPLPLAAALRTTNAKGA